MNSNEISRYKDVCAAAHYLGVGKSTLDKKRVYGGGPRFSKLGKRVVYDTNDLDAWVDKNRRASTSAES